MKKIAYSICFVSGIIFIFAGIVKLFPINSFEFQMVTQGQANYAIAPYLSRLIIGFEILLGIGLLQRFWLKQIIIPASVLLLAVFSLYLGIKIFQGGSPDNCGCFGQILPMSNTAALIKNLILIVLILFAYKKIETDIPGKLLYIVIPAVCIYAFLFIAFPVKKYVVPNVLAVPPVVKDTLKIVSSAAEFVTKKIPDVPEKKVKKDSTRVIRVIEKTVSVYTPFSVFTTLDGSKTVDLNDGEKIVAILSLDCDHCIAAAKCLSELYKKGKIPKVYALFLGEENQVNPFFEQTGYAFPYIILPPEKFFPLLEQNPPRIVYLNNGNVISDQSGEAFSAEKL